MFVKKVSLILRLFKFSKTLQFFVFSTRCVIKRSYTNHHIFQFGATQYYRTYYQKKNVRKLQKLYLHYKLQCFKYSCCLAKPRKGFIGGVIVGYITKVYCQCLYQQCCVRYFKQEAFGSPAQITSRVWRRSFLPSTLNDISNTKTKTNTNLEPRPTLQPQNRCFAKCIFKSVVLVKIQTKFSSTVAF